MGNYPKAIDCYTETIEILEKIGDKKKKCLRLGTLGDIYCLSGENRKAIEYYDKALEIAKDLGDKFFIGRLSGGLGNSYGEFVNYQKVSGLGDYRTAIKYFEKALSIAEEIGDKQGEVMWLNGLGSSYMYLGEYQKAAHYAEEALIVAEQTGSTEQVKSVTIMNQGTVYFSLGDYNKAINNFEIALALSEKLGDKNNKKIILHNLGISYAYLGDYWRAIACSEKAIALAKELHLPYDNLEPALGGYHLALGHYEIAVDIITRQDQPLLLGLYYLKKKDFRKAVEQFNRGRQEDEKFRRSTQIARWIGLGIAYEESKEYEEAYQWYKKAIEYMEDQRTALSPLEREHYFEGKSAGFQRTDAYEGAVRCAFMLGRQDEAFYWAENTRGRILSELLSKRYSGASYKIPGNIADEEEELANKIMMNKRQQETAFEKNNPDLLKKVEAEYPALRAKMDDLIDRLRKEYPQYASIKYPQPVRLSQLALKKGEVIIEYEVTDPYTIGLIIRDGNVIKAFKVDKTRTELERMIMKYRAPFQEGSNMNEFSLNVTRDLTNLLMGPALPFLKKGEHLIIIPDKSLSLLPFESLLLSAPDAALKEEATLLAQATKQTDSDTIDKATIIRGLTKAPATRSSVVNVVPRVTTHILFETGSAQIKIESQKQLKEIASALASKELKNATIQIEGHTDSVGDPKYNMRLSFKRAQAVYDYLSKSGIRADRLTYTGKGDTEPIADNKDDTGKRLNRRVDFVRIDSLGAQRTSSFSSSQITDLVYAMDEYPISYYQSASVLTLQRGLHINRIKEQTFFGLGDPVFDDKDDRASDKRAVKIVAKKAEISSKDIVDNEVTKDAGYKFSRLVNTAKEVKEVGKLFSKSKTMLGLEATEEKLKAEDLTSRKYVLFSTHGILGNEIPYIKQPALVLSLVGNDKEDGFLTASEIFNLNLNADIVALSACKTGLGVQSAGEGVVGLSRAFMYAGTDTVLVSLWSVSDESTYKLMVKFFEAMKTGKDKLTALKEAKDYLRKNGYENPFFWAPFILVGETN